MFMLLKWKKMLFTISWRMSYRVYDSLWQFMCATFEPSNMWFGHQKIVNSSPWLHRPLPLSWSRQSTILYIYNWSWSWKKQRDGYFVYYFCIHTFFSILLSVISNAAQYNIFILYNWKPFKGYKNIMYIIESWTLYYNNIYMWYINYLRSNNSNTSHSIMIYF